MPDLYNLGGALVYPPPPVWHVQVHQSEVRWKIGESHPGLIRDIHCVCIRHGIAVVLHGTGNMMDLNNK